MRPGRYREGKGSGRLGERGPAVREGLELERGGEELDDHAIRNSRLGVHEQVRGGLDEVQLGTAGD